MYQTTVTEFLKDDAGNLTGAIISYLKPERNPETGRTSMVPTGEEFTYNCQLAFIAAGLQQKYGGLILETIHHPDTPHHPEFPSCVLRPHEKYYSVTEYRFTVQK